MKNAMKKILGATVLTTAMAAVALPALAGPGGDQGGRWQQAGERGTQLFSKLDLDGDGAVTLQEIEDGKTARFAAIDADGNDLVTAEELAAHQTAQEQERKQQRMAKLVTRMDKDGDGMLSAEEMAAKDKGPMTNIFETADADKDGKVTEEEFKTAMAQFGGKKGGRFGGERPEGGRFGKHAH